MLYTGLDRVARKTGYPVVEAEGWKTRGHGHMGTVKTIVAHHTAGGARGNAPSLGVVQNGRSDLPGPLSHYVLGRDGTIYVVAAGLCAHAGKDSQLKADHRNVHSIGIEAENTGVGEPWGNAQMDAYVKLCAALVTEFGLTPANVLGHKEIAPGRKIDPAGIDMGDFRRRITAQIAGTLIPVAATKPEPVAPSIDIPEYDPQELLKMELTDKVTNLRGVALEKFGTSHTVADLLAYAALGHFTGATADRKLSNDIKGLANATPADVAAAIPEDIAAAVAELLANRLKGVQA